MPGSEKLKKLHSNLLNQGYDLPDYSTFEVDMQDDKKLNKLHSNLSGQGYDIPDYNTFKSDMGYVSKAPEVKKKDQPSQITQEPSIDTSSLASGQSGQPSGQGSSLLQQLAQKQQAELTPGTPEYNYRQSVIAKDKAILETQKAGKQPVLASTAKPTFYEKETPEVKTESVNVTPVVAPKSLEEKQGQKNLTDNHLQVSDKVSEEELTNFLGNPNTQNRIPGVYEPNYSKEEVDQIQGDNLFRMSHQEQESIVAKMVSRGVSEEFAREKLASKIDGHIQKSSDELKQDLIFQKEQFLNSINGAPKTIDEIKERRKDAIKLETQDIMDYGYSKLDKEYQELIPVSKEYWSLIEKAKTAKPEEKFEINKKLYLLNEKLKAGREGKKNLTDPITGTNGTKESEVYTQAVNNYKQRYSGTSRDKMIQMYQEKAHEIKFLEGYIKKYKSEDPFKGPSQDDAKSQLRNKKAEFEALSEIMLLNEDPASLERGVFKGLLTSAGKSMAESVGIDVTSNTEIAQRFGESMNKAGLPLTKEQEERIKSTSAENVGEVLGELPATAVKFIIANKALSAVKGLEAIAKFAESAEAGLGGGKIARYSANILESTLKGAAEGAIVNRALGDENISASMMGAEGLAESLFENIVPINNKWAKIAAEMVVGGIGSTAGEYLGDYVENVVSDYKYHGLDTDRAFEKTFGRTPEEIGDKFLTIATVSFLFPGIKGSMEAFSNVVVAKKYFEQTGDRKRLEELQSFAKKNGVDLNKVEESIKEKPAKAQEKTLSLSERVLRRSENLDIMRANGSTFYDEIDPMNAKIGDEVVYTKDSEGDEIITKVKDIVDGKLVFENGETIDEVFAFMNNTAEDAWFAKNKPEPTPATLSDIESTAKALEGTKFNANFNLPLEQIKNPTQVSEAYHKAKLDNSNPELVEAVEQIIGKPKEAASITEPTLVTKTPAGKELEIPEYNEANPINSRNDLPSNEAKDNLDSEEVKNRNTDLFPDESVFGVAGSTSGKLKEKAKLSSYREVNGIGSAEYTNPKTGVVDVYISARNDNSYAAFIRIYDSKGNPTNRFTSKFENTNGSKSDFKQMIQNAQENLPEGHEYTEDTSISTDGLRVYEQQLSRGYEILRDKDGKPVTNEVAINGDSKTNILGIPVPSGFQNIVAKTQQEFNKVKEALKPFAEKLGLSENDIIWEGSGSGKVSINLPVLKSVSNLSEKQTSQTSPATEATISASEQAAPKTETTQDQVQPTTEATTKTPAGKETTTAQAGSVVGGDIKPIRQLGTEANVYFETEKHRVNDNLKNGKVLLNIGSKESEVPVANIEFDSAIEAVNVAKELNRIYPKGVPDAVLINKVVENIKKELKSSEESLKATTQQSTEELTIESPKPSAEVIEGDNKAETKGKVKEKAAKGFISVALNKLTKSLKDFQGRGKEYSQQTYDRIVNEAKGGALNISSIPPIQIWKDKNGNWVILGGHSRTKAFEDLAAGKHELNPKYKKADFASISAQIVEANTLEEAQKIAQESNQGAVQTVVDNAKYVREKLMPTFKSFNDAKTKLRDLYGAAWTRIYAYANLNPKGKAMAYLKAFSENLESESTDISRKMAEWTGKAMSDFNKLTAEHENEIFNYLLENTKIKTYNEFYDILNRRINGIEGFVASEPLNFSAKVGRGSNEVEVIKEIQDAKAEKKRVEDEIRKVQKTEKNKAVRDKTISELTKESIRLNTLIGDLEKKQAQAKEGDALQFNLFNNLNEQIENGNINAEQAEQFLDETNEVEPIIADTERKAESNNEAELNEAIKQADELINNAEQETPQAETPAIEKTNAEKAAEAQRTLADKFRKLKIKKPDAGNLFASTPFDLVWDGALEVIAKSLEASASVTEAAGKALEYIKNSDWYKGLTSEQKAKAEQNLKTHIENEMSAFEAEQKPTEEPAKKEEPKAGKERTKESKGFKRARLNELDPEIKAKLEGVANYKVQDNKEFNDKIIEFVDEVTPEIAIEYAMDMSENLSDGSAIRKKVILYNAGSKMKMKASEKLKNAKKEGDLAAESEAEAELALAYNAILTASKIGTAAGQLNAIDAELHKKYPSLYMIVAMNEFNKNGNEVLDDNTKFKDESGKDITVAEAIEKERVKIEDEIRKEVEKEFNSRIDELNNEIENLKKDKPVDKKKEIEEKQKKLADRRKEIIAQLKKSGGVAQATFIPFTTKQIELIGELIANLVQSGGLSSKQIINEVVSVVKSFNSAVNKNHIQDIAKSVVEFNEKLTEENATKKNKDKGDEAPKTELTSKKLKEIAMAHLFDRKGVAQTLAKAIIEETGMDAKQANAIAENISKSIIDPIIDEVIDRRLLNIIKPTETNANLTDEQIKNKKENRKTANKIKEAIKLGVLSNNEIFQSAFEEKFGFRTLDARTKAKLNNIIEELTKLEADVSKTVSIDGKEATLDTTQRERILDLQKEFNTILQSSTPLNLAIVLSEINSAIYLSILSNPTSTSLKAFIGSFSGAAFGVFSDAFTKGPIATLAGIAATVKPSNIEASLQRAATALKSGLVEVGKTKQSGEFSSERQSAIENALFNGLSEAMKNKEKGKIILKSIGIALKNIRILAAMDAFLVSQTGIYSEAANGSKAKKGGFADRINPKNQEKVFNDIAEKEYSNIKSDIESDVDGDIKSGTVESKNREKEIERRLKIRAGSLTSPSSAYKTKRVQELTENQRIDNFKKAWSLAQYFSLIGKPDGFLGMGTSWAQRKMSIKPNDNATDASLKFASQMVFKFVNLMGNMYNATMTSIPVLGLANAFFGVGYDPIKGEYVKGILGKYNANKPLLATRVATNLIITGLVIAALEDQLMWDDEEEKYVLNPDRDFDFRGAGFPGIGGYSKNRRTNENYEEFSFSFMKDKNGKFTNYHSFNKYVPQLNAIVATVSAVTDDLKGMDDKLNIKERQDSPFIGYGYKAIGSNIKGFLEGSFNSLGRITKPFLFEESAIDALAQVATNTIVDNAGSLTRPNVVNSVINYVKAANNIPASKRNTLGEKLATAIYMENFFNQDKTDSFGNPIPQTQDFERFITEIPKQSELYPKTAGLMYKFDTGLEISKWRATEVKGYENFNLKGVSYYSTEDVREEATKVQEQEFNRLVTENYAKLNKMDYEKLNKAVKKYQEKSKEYAKKQLVDKYLDVNNKKSIIKKVEK